MYFETIENLIQMGGHGVYVWTCYLIALLVVGYNLVSPLLARKRAIDAVRCRIRREKRT